VDKAKTVASVVSNVLGPGSALNVDQHVGRWSVKLNSNNGGEVARGVPVWEVVAWEALPGEVLDGANILFISWVLTLAGHPDHLGDNITIICLALSNVILEALGHVIGQLFQLLIDYWHPIDHLVKLEENARRLAVVAPALSLLALALEPCVLKAAHLAILGWGGFTAVGDVLARNVIACALIWLDEFIKGIDPVFDVFALSMLVPDQGGLNVLLTGERSEAHSWVTEDGAAITGLVLGEMVGVQGLVEDGHHNGKEASQEGVEDQVEEPDLHP